MTNMEKFNQWVESPLSRRSFAKGLGFAAAGVAGAGLLGGTAMKALAQSANPETAAITDTDILNFALNLEYLEAEYYLMTTYGTTLVRYGVISESDTTGPTTGGHMVPNFGKSPFAFAASAIRNDEVAHVKFLRSALGSAAVKKPAINLNALGYGFANTGEFLKLARQFEDVGVSAYDGAAPLIQNKTYLEAAARIYGMEAQHSGTIRFACIYWGVNSPAVDSQDVVPTASTPFDDPGNSALAVSRSTSQVLNIVYHGGSHSGGFFPDGLNGTIK